MVVQPLRHQVQRQCVLSASRLLDFGPFVLEPDFDLGLVELQFGGEALSSLLCQVPVRLKLRLQPLQLLRREGRAWPLILPSHGLLLWSARSGP